MTQPTIAEKHHSTLAAEKILAGALRGRGGKLTKADAIAVTGLPQQEIEPALEVLLKEYKSHLEVTDKGEILYEFDPDMARRDAVPVRERLAAAGRFLWKAFVALFKVCILLTIVLYVLVYLAILVALMFSDANGGNSSGGGSRRRRSSFGGSGFGDGLLWYLLLDSWMQPSYPVHIERGRFAERPPKKPFIAAVFDFCFGPPHPPADPLETEKRILAYVRAHAGRITASDLVALTGWPYEKAEEEVTRLLVDYSGEPEVTDDGAIVYVFKDLRVTAGEDETPEKARRALATTDDRPRYFWQQPDPKERLTGNAGGQNAWIIGLSLFNVFGALVLGSVGVQMVAMHYAATGLLDASVLETAQFWIITFPLAFTVIYLGVPMLRAIGLWRRERERRARNVRRGLLRAVFDAQGQPFEPSELVGRVSGADPAARPIVRAELERMLVPYEGDVQADDRSGAMRYRFPRLERELAAATRLRATASTDELRAGQVVFDTDK